jgi:hypothetical protein
VGALNQLGGQVVAVTEKLPDRDVKAADQNVRDKKATGSLTIHYSQGTPVAIEFKAKH